MLQDLTWTCHSCGKCRPDEKISVLSWPLIHFMPVHAERNWRYCNDDPECLRIAEETRDEYKNKNSAIPK